MRVNAGFGELGRHCSRKGPASKMLPTADQVRGSTAINLMGDSIAGTTQSSRSRLRWYGEFGSATGELEGSTLEYRVSGVGMMDGFVLQEMDDGRQVHPVIAAPVEHN